MRSRRWARRQLDTLEAPRPSRPGPAACPHWHPGPCHDDYWGACSGMNLTLAGREALAALHPWRVDR